MSKSGGPWLQPMRGPVPRAGGRRHALPTEEIPSWPAAPVPGRTFLRVHQLSGHPDCPSCSQAFALHQDVPPSGNRSRQAESRTGQRLEWWRRRRRISSSPTAKPKSEPHHRCHRPETLCSGLPSRIPWSGQRLVRLVFAEQPHSEGRRTATTRMRS